MTGVVNHFATYVSLWAADSFGRRILFLEGGVQMLLSLVGTSPFLSPSKLLMSISQGSGKRIHFRSSLCLCCATDALYAANIMQLRTPFKHVTAQTGVVLGMAGGHWNDTGIGRSAAQRCVDSIVFHVLLHLCVCLVMGTSALALCSRSAILGDPLCWAEHSNPHQFAVLLCHWTGTTPCSNQNFTLFRMSACRHWEFL